MVKRAVIVVELIDESEEVSDYDIEVEIFRELNSGSVTIPWVKNVKKVSVSKT
jgi:predicted DNA-binding protein